MSLRIVAWVPPVADYLSSNANPVCSKELDDLLTIDENIGLSEGQVSVRGQQGGDVERNVTWYGGSSTRFTVALWMRHLIGEATASEGLGVSQLRNGRETIRVAGNIFSELHSDG